jgi:PAS domain S-box-containing protein
MAELTGSPPDEHLGRTPVELLGAEEGTQFAEAVAEVLRTGAPIVDREVAVERGGRTSHREATWFPVLGPGGGVSGVGAVVRDVTHQHDAEAERARLLKQALSSRAQAEAAMVRAENARAEADIARRRTDFLARAGERLAVVTRDYDRTLQEVARVAVPQMADWCTFTLREARGQLRTAAVAAADPELERVVLEMAQRQPPRLDAPAGAGYTIRTGEPQLVPEVPPELLETLARDDEQLALLRRMGLRSGLTVPLKLRDRAIGALSLVYSTSGRVYGPDDVTLAESLAVRAALAVENARLLDERSHIAQTLQRSLLPPALPDVDGLDIAARYRAAGDQNEVGGDFYDVFRAGDGVWTFVIGDVSGKGAEAAAVTSLTRHTLRAASLRETGPRQTLELLNDALLAQPDPAGRFCTVLLGRTTSAPGGGVDLTLATGGHLPPMIVRVGGRVERIQLRGSIVGGFDRPHFGQREVHLDPGDVLVTFTDGVTEVRSREPDLGEEALEEVLRAHRGEAVEDIVAAIEARAVELQAGEPRDDIALLALRAQP